MIAALRSITTTSARMAHAQMRNAMHGGAGAGLGLGALARIRIAPSALLSRRAFSPAVAVAAAAKTDQGVAHAKPSQPAPKPADSRSQMANPDLKPHLPAPIRSEFAIADQLSTADLEKIDVSVGVNRSPLSISDWTALGTVKFLRFFADLFFRNRYVHRAVVLETVAAVPGMVAGMLRHLSSLRRMRHDGGWITHLLTEAENERMHLMTWMKVCHPSFFERILIFAVQGVFFNVYFLAYLLFPRTAHRMVGYLEEEAVISYTHFLNQIDAGKIENGPAPHIAKEYWRLGENATIRDVVLAVRADEANHRDVNHHFADRLSVHEEDLRKPVSPDSIRPFIKYRKISIKE